MCIYHHLNSGALATDVFGVGDGGPVFLSEVQCTGSGSRLILCPSLGLGQHSCTAEMSTGVFCDMRGKMRACFKQLHVVELESNPTRGQIENSTMCTHVCL